MTTSNRKDLLGPLVEQALAPRRPRVGRRRPLLLPGSLVCVAMVLLAVALYQVGGVG